MPPGNTLAKAPAKVVEKVTVEACIAIAHRVQLPAESPVTRPDLTPPVRSPRSCARSS